MKIAVLLSLLAASLLQAADTYELLVLGSPTTESCAYSVNNSGFSVGYSIDSGKAVPYLWNPEKGFIALPDLPSTASSPGIAYGINDYFEIVGTYGTYSSGPDVFHIQTGTGMLWLFNTSVNDFIPYDDIYYPGTMVRDISNSSYTAGQELNPDAPYNHRAFTWDFWNLVGYTATDDGSFCYGVNDQGNATGSISGGGSTRYPTFIKRLDDTHYAVTSGAPALGLSSGISSGQKISNLNQIVGNSPLGGFYWEPEVAGVHTFFGAGTFCYSINNFGKVVGSSGGNATMWTKQPNGSFVSVDLNTLSNNPSYRLEKAFDINDKGQIVGQCYNNVTAIRRAFLLTPARAVQGEPSRNGNDMKLSWPGLADHDYSIRTSTDLLVWTSLDDIYAATATGTAHVLVPTNERMRYFKVFDLTP